jgi:uncharacterized protein
VVRVTLPGVAAPAAPSQDGDVRPLVVNPSQEVARIMGSPVVHFEISGRDAERSRSFYSGLFGWSVQVDGRGYGMVATGSEDGIAGGIMQTPPDASPWVTLYVGVDDMATSLARVEDLGGRRITEPSPVAGVGVIAMFADPDGNMIGLIAPA